MIDMIVKNKDTGVFVLNIQKATINSQTSELWEDYINDTFVYFTEEDTSKTATRDYQDDSKDNTIERDDRYKEITIGLLSQKLVNANMRSVSGSIDCADMQSAAIYVIGDKRPLVIEPFTNNKAVTGLELPPVNSKAKGIKYLNSIATFYNYDYLYFMDFDRTYLISRSGKLVARKGDPISTVMITLRDEFDQDSENISIRADGMYIDNSAKMAKIDVIGTSTEIADYRDRTKAYTDIKSSMTVGGEESMQIFDTNKKNFVKKTMTVRAPNDNTNLVTNRERVSRIYLSVNKNDLDVSIFTPNKEYQVSTKEIYPDKDYDGKYILRNRRELFYRSTDSGSADQFICNTMLILEKAYEG